MPFLASIANFGLRLILVVSVLLNVVTTFASSSLPITECSQLREIAVDSAGNVYFINNTTIIRKITPQGVVSTLAGTITPGSANGTGTNATFTNAYGIAVDSAGNVYVSEQANFRIRKITPAGEVTTFAGSGTSGYLDGLGTNALLGAPRGLAIDSAGNLYVADSARIRKISPGGVVTTLAGGRTAGALPEYDGTGTNAKISNAFHISVDLNGNLFITNETNTRNIRKITSTGVVTTFAGVGAPGTTTFTTPAGVANDSSGNLYVLECITVGRIIKLTPTAVATTLPLTFSEYGRPYGFSSPFGITCDSTGNLYVTDPGNRRICKVDINGNVTTLAGRPTDGYRDGPANFNAPTKLTCDLIGNVYVCDTNNHRICRITPNGFSSTLTGGPNAAITSGSDINARFSGPRGIVMGDLLYLVQADNYVTSIGRGGGGFTVGRINPTIPTTVTGITMDGSQILYLADPVNHMIYKQTTITPLTRNDFAGNYAAGFVDGTGYSARFNTPRGLTSDLFGNIYVADSGNNRIRKITPAGAVTTIAGNGASGSLDGTGTNATFNFPNDIIIDSLGTLYVADTNNHLIRKIDTSGKVTTLAGNGIAQLTNGIGTSASFNFPQGVALDKWGNLYVADTNNNLIRKITNVLTVPNLTMTTSLIAGNGTATFLDGIKSNTSFNGPRGIVFDKIGNLYIADTNNRRIRKISPAGVVTTIAGNGTSGTTEGNGTNATFTSPNGIAIDVFDNVYIADSGIGIRKILSGIVSNTVTGIGPNDVALNHFNILFMSFNSGISFFSTSGVVVYLTNSGAGFADGTGTNAQFNNPQGIAFDSVGNLYVADASNHRIRKVIISYRNDGGGSSSIYFSSTSVVTTFAGSGTPGSTDGTGVNARFNNPNGIAFDGFGNLYVADSGNHIIRKITPTGIVTTIAGIAGSSGYPIGSGMNSRFNFPNRIAVDPLGIIYVTELSNHIIRKIEYNITTTLNILGIVTSFAGNGLSSFVNGTGTNATFCYPYGVAVNSAGNIYVADSGNNVIRQITPTGVVTTFVGNPNRTAGATNGTGTNAIFNAPAGIAVDSGGTLYVTDSGNGIIRRITTAGVVSTLISSLTTPSGIAIDSFLNVFFTQTTLHSIYSFRTSLATFAGSGIEGFADGTGTNAQFRSPQGVAFDLVGNLYVADTGNHCIRKITTAGVVSTLAGTTTAGFTNGTGTNARFNSPIGITVDLAGTVYVAEQGNHCIRKITSEGVVSTLTGSGFITPFANGTGTNATFNTPQGLTVDSSGVLYVADTGNQRIRRIT